MSAFAGGPTPEKKFGRGFPRATATKKIRTRVKSISSLANRLVSLSILARSHGDNMPPTGWWDLHFSSILEPTCCCASTPACSSSSASFLPHKSRSCCAWLWFAICCPVMSAVWVRFPACQTNSRKTARHSGSKQACCVSFN